MALTPTNMIPLGFDAPEFQLPDVISGNVLNFRDLKSEKATVAVFICNHCPCVRHIMSELVQVGREYIPKGVSFIMINSNDVEMYPDDSPEKMKRFAAENEFPFPYLFDENQEVARAFDAACTPDFNVIDSKGKVVYRGRFDDSRPENGRPVTGKDLRNALESLLRGEKVSEDQIPSIGCNIKWKQQ